MPSNERVVEGSEVERRAARRWFAGDLPWPLACRITPGRDVEIVNISISGMLVESSAPFSPGRTVTLHLIRAPQRVALEGTIVHSYLAALNPVRAPVFRAGIAFDRRFDAMRELESV